MDQLYHPNDPVTEPKTTSVTPMSCIMKYPQTHIPRIWMTIAIDVQLQFMCTNELTTICLDCLLEIPGEQRPVKAPTPCLEVHTTTTGHWDSDLVGSLPQS